MTEIITKSNIESEMLIFYGKKDLNHLIEMVDAANKEYLNGATLYGIHRKYPFWARAFRAPDVDLFGLYECGRDKLFVRDFGITEIKKTLQSKYVVHFNMSRAPEGCGLLKQATDTMLRFYPVKKDSLSERFLKRDVIKTNEEVKKEKDEFVKSVKSGGINKFCKIFLIGILAVILVLKIISAVINFLVGFLI